MIHDIREYELAISELRDLETRLENLQRDYPTPQKGLTKAGVRKMLARLHEELAVYEGMPELDSTNV